MYGRSLLETTRGRAGRLVEKVIDVSRARLLPHENQNAEHIHASVRDMKQKAKEGTFRRRQLKASPRKVIANNIRTLIAVTLLTIGTLSLMSAEFGGAWRLRLYGSSRPDLLQISEEAHELSTRASREGWLVMNPVLLDSGGENDVVDKVAPLIKRYQPRLLAVTTPQRFMALTRPPFNKHTNAERQRRKDIARESLSFARHVLALLIE